MVNNIKIGEFIRTKRKELHLSQKELASKLNMSFQAVSKWETGETLPDVSVLVDLADVLNTTTDKILNGGQIIVKKNKMIQVENIIEGFKALENLRFYFGEQSTFYKGAIKGINEQMDIDFEEYMKNKQYRETMLAEAIIQYLMNGYQIDPADIEQYITSVKLKGIIYRYIGDDNKIVLLNYEDNPRLFDQIRSIRPEFKQLSQLNELPGEFIRMEAGKTYLGTQIETNEDYCFGIAVDETTIHVFTYGENGINQKKVHEEKIKL